MNFVILDRDSKHLRDWFRQFVPDFFASSEHLDLNPESDGILVAAYTRYLLRVIQEENRSEIERGFDLLERMAVSKDPDVVNYVVTEVFENLSASGPALSKFESELREHTRRLYGDWFGQS